MTTETEALERYFDAINRNDLHAVATLLHRDVVRIEPEGFATGRTYRGAAQVAEHIAEGRGTWAEGTCSPERFLVNGERAVAYVHVRVRLHGSAEWLEGRFADGFEFRDGRIALHRSFAERTHAVEWAGIDPSSVAADGAT